MPQSKKTISKKKAAARTRLTGVERSVAKTGKEEEQSLRVQYAPELWKGTYANSAVIRHTRREFIVDFLLGISDDAHLVSRVITSPQHAKALYEALGQNIQKFEKSYGKIPDDE